METKMFLFSFLLLRKWVKNKTKWKPLSMLLFKQLQVQIIPILIMNQFLGISFFSHKMTSVKYSHSLQPEHSYNGPNASSVLSGGHRLCLRRDLGTELGVVGWCEPAVGPKGSIWVWAVRPGHNHLATSRPWPYYIPPLLYLHNSLL